MAEGTQTISFRVSAAVAARLGEAGAREGLSRSEFARKLVESSLAAVGSGGAEAGEILGELRALKELVSRAQASAAPTGNTASDGKVVPSDAASRADISRELRRVDTHLNELRSALATGITCLLSQVGGVEPREAEAWVVRHMFSTDK